tara:strand:- start:2746 stop:3261 length:516 start_codon:yes stop_codon:yes gene_type:complete
MMKSILLTYLLSLMLSTLTFAQESETPQKERNWIIGVGAGFPTETSYDYYTFYDQYYNATVGYRGFTASLYLMPSVAESLWDGKKRNPIFGVRYTLGYQHVFSKKSNAKLKPIVGLEYGYGASAVNTGIRYKRSQVLLSIITNSSGNIFFIPLRESSQAKNYATLKYQFLL